MRSGNWSRNARFIPENARLAWEPILHNQTLPYFLPGVLNLPTQIIWGREDAVVPVSAAAAYRNALRNTGVKVAIFDHCGHRPEIENGAEFERLVDQPAQAKFVADRIGTDLVPRLSTDTRRSVKGGDVERQGSPRG